jgi:TolB-like protein/DNA-binding winged helix-turn-helix (wHTH) protein
MSDGDEVRPRIYRFGPFEIDVEQRLLLRSGDLVPLTPKAFDTLEILVARHGKLVDKTELLKLVWPDTFVEENNLTQNISALRRVLGGGDYIETIPRRGYRFLMRVEEVSAVGTTEADRPLSPLPGGAYRFRSRWIWGMLAIAAVATLTFFPAEGIRHAGQPDHRVDSLVVLPFVNLTAAAENEYFCDGLTEELTNALAHLEGLRVVARTTAFQFKGKARDIRAIGQQLRVTAVLEGSVRVEDKRLRVTVQLNDARSGYHIWSQTFDREKGEIFNMQEDISSQVAHTIRPSGKPVRAATGSNDLDAYNLYLRGRFHLRKPDEASVRKAIEFFEQAIHKDRRYAAAYAGLAESYMALAQEGSNPLQAWGSGQEAARKALSLDANLAEAHTTQAIVYLFSERNWEAAERQFQRAIELNPNEASAHHWFSHYFMAMGRLAESLAESRRALELDPLDVQISSHLIWHYLGARDYPNAIKAGLQTLELDPHAQLAFNFLTRAYEDTELWDRAIESSEPASVVDPEASILRAAVQTDGPRGYWRARLAVLSKEGAENYRFAGLHARLGESDKALERLERAFQVHEPDLIYVKRDPAFDWLQGSPRFKALTDAMKLP